MRDLALKSKTCKERYKWYYDHGLCTTCGRVWAEPGKVRCKACEAKIAMYHERSKEQRQERQRQRREERIAAGLCTECGKRPANPGMRMCERCRMMRNDSTRKYKIQKRIEREAQKARAKNGNGNDS